MDPNTRRRALQAGGMTLATALAGCSLAPGSQTENEPDFDTPPPGECKAVEPPTSGPTKGGLEPIPYPAYPEEISAETARSFAREYERAYRRNGFIRRYEDTGYDELTVQLGALRIDERDDGYVVGINGAILFADAEQPETTTGTARPAGRGSFAAWYLVAERFALRKDLEGSLPEEEDPDLSGADVVACDE